MKKKWNPPEDWVSVETIDMHTEGEPLRIILSGFPDLPGKTILEKRRYYLENHDSLRTALMWEPRGHADMYGCILVSPERGDSDIGVVFTHNEGYSTMCGHGILGVTKAVFELGLRKGIIGKNTVKIDSPAGLITGFAEIEKEKISKVWFHNVPSYAAILDGEVKVDGLGTVRFDLAFGGAYYAYVDADELGLELVPENKRKIIETGMAVKKAVMNGVKIEHPFEKDLSFLYGTIFTASPETSGNHSRNVCVFADGEVDRSPTGTGVSGRAAIHYARKEIRLGEEITIESIIGSTFNVSVVKETVLGPYEAVIPKVSGRAFITGRHTFLIDPDDPLKDGFFLR